MFELQKEISVCFTGHRNIMEKLHSVSSVAREVRSILTKLCDSGYTNFLCGMAVGFDMLAGEVVLELQKIYPEINLISVVPCKEQARNFSRVDKARYDRLLSLARDVVYTSSNYEIGCMHKRNRYLVDNASVCVAYLYQYTGGTFYTVNYANANDCEVIKVTPCEVNI